MLINEITLDIGKQIHESEWLEITQDMINKFASATLDNQWIHTDPERAKIESPFGGAVAHGFLMLSLYPHLRGLVDPKNPPFPSVKQAINYGLNKLRLMNPVNVGSIVKGCSVLLDAKETEYGVRITEEFTVHIQGEKKPALVGELITLLG